MREIHVQHALDGGEGITAHGRMDFANTDSLRKLRPRGSWACAALHAYRGVEERQVILKSEPHVCTAHACDTSRHQRERCTAKCLPVCTKELNIIHCRCLEMGAALCRH